MGVDTGCAYMLGSMEEEGEVTQRNKGDPALRRLQSNRCGCYFHGLGPASLCGHRGGQMRWEITLKTGR